MFATVRLILSVSWVYQLLNAPSVLLILMILLQCRPGLERELMGRVAKLKLQYFCHITRGSAGQLALTVLEGIMEGLRHQGRPRRQWIHDIEEWTGCEYIQLNEMSKDRAQWRRKISEWSSAVVNPHRGRSTSEWVSESLIYTRAHKYSTLTPGGISHRQEVEDIYVILRVTQWYCACAVRRNPDLPHRHAPRFLNWLTLSRTRVSQLEYEYEYCRRVLGSQRACTDYW